MSEAKNLRALALKIILKVTEEGGFSHLLLKSTLDEHCDLKREERAFLTFLTEGTLERIIELDYCINLYSSLNTAKMKPIIRGILRMSAYQILHMDGTPDYAACSEAVRLTRTSGLSGLCGYVNAVLRNLIRDEDKIKWPDPAEKPLQSLSVRTSTPEWLCIRLINEYGEKKTRDILDATLIRRPMDIRINLHRISAENFALSMQGAGISAEDISGFFVSGESTRERDDGHIFSPALPGAFALSECGAPEEIPGFSEGHFIIQDRASMCVCEAVIESFLADTWGSKRKSYADDNPMMAIDLCAAPGGKSISLAMRFKSRCRVIAGDIYPGKVDSIRTNIRRMRLDNIEARVWDARIPDKDLTGMADIVMLDAPCSGIGVIGKKPEIKYRISAKSISDLASLQREMIDTACLYVKKGGVIIYCTCTFMREENEENAVYIEKSYPEIKKLFSRQFLPDEGCDGFFIAAFRRS